MAINKQRGEIISFLKEKDYIMLNNDLGSGSFGKTVLIKDPFIGELFVAKKYEPQYAEIKEQFFKNFLDEIKILYKLNHKNIVHVYNYYAYEDACTGYIIMEYIEGGTVDDFINGYFAPLEKVTLEDVFLQLIDAFCYMEEHGIIHRDIREGNILIDDDGVVKVIDFGIGKIVATPEEDSTDSLVTEVNREGLDTLPQEYYERKYTNLTDMFYLAELFGRLIDNAEDCDRTDFDYNDILDKMMEKRPENRFESFAAIREAIGKRDFVNMEVSDKDRKIYQDFTNLVYESLLSYGAEPKFNSNCINFISRLEKTIKVNLFEEVVQKNADVISSVVDCAYCYNNGIDIPVETVRKFLEWFRGSTPQSQALVLNNFISKLSAVKVDPDVELPF